MKDKFKINKYYVGATHLSDAIEHSMNSDWTHAKLEDAIEHAKKVLERNSNQNTVIVCSIIRLVKRQPLPVTIEKV